MGLFPIDANDGDEVTNTNGTVYKYNAAEDRWYIIGNVAAIENIVDDVSPQLGGALDTAGNSINDDTGDNIVDINDHLNVQGNITLTGTVDGVDIATRDHAVVVAGDLNHNDLANLNLGDVYEHISAAQLAALHAKQHAMDSATFHTSSDIATLNTSTTKHGFLKKLDNNPLNYMDGQGNWSVPAGGGVGSLDDVFDVGKIIDGANSEANAVKIGDGIDNLDIFVDNDNVQICQNDATTSAERGQLGLGGPDEITNLRPNSDILTQWTSSDGGTHYTDVNQDIVQPTAGAEPNINNSTINKREEFGLTGVPGLVKSYIVWIEGYTSSGTSKDLDVYINYNDGGGLVLIGSVTFTDGSYSWDSITVNDINKDGIGWSIQLYQIDHGSFMAVQTLYVAATNQSIKPLKDICVRRIYSDDGTLLSYSTVDDLQLLRELKEWDVREKVVNERFPTFTQKVWDKETIPWIRAHPDVNLMDKNDNKKRYQSSFGQKIGYVLSTMKKMLEIIDTQELRILKLEKGK